MSISMDHEERCGHLPAVFRDLVCRLKSANPIGRKMPISWDAAKHGLHRRRQGYSAVMLVEESRMLQISIFQILQQNLDTIDFSVLLNGMMVIADGFATQPSTGKLHATISDSAIGNTDGCCYGDPVLSLLSAALIRICT
jgi:hypothetical protein